MGAGQSDLYKGTYGDNLDNIPDELKGKVKMPPNDAQLKHFMRDGEGHLPDTPENRKLLADLANDKKYHMGKDKYGNEWHVRKNNDGTQDWVRHRNQVINEGGRNKVERSWNSETGLFKNVSSKMRRKR